MPFYLVYIVLCPIFAKYKLQNKDLTLLYEKRRYGDFAEWNTAASPYFILVGIVHFSGRGRLEPTQFF